MKLSIVMFTYNHEKFVEEAINSVLNQQVNFEYKLLIFDDASSDSTSQILFDYKQKFPERITVFSNHKNKGILSNSFSVFKHIKGDFLAFLDGDDCWTNLQKLQKQVDFLESNLDYNGCFHDAEIEHLDESENFLFKGYKSYAQYYKYNKEIFTTDIINRTILPTSGLILRTWFLRDIKLSLFKDNYSIIWKLCCLAVKGSKFYFIDEKWSKYRNHKSGISKSDNLNFHLSHANFLETIAPLKGFEIDKFEIYKSASNEYMLVLNRSKSKDFLLKKVFVKYLFCEIKKMYAFYRQIFNK